MQTFKFVLVTAVVLSAAFAGADGIPSASAEAYYHTHFEKRPEGAYEWPEQDLVFVKVCIPRKSQGVDAAELSATRRVLRMWLASKAAVKRVDPHLPYGRDMARRLCRKYLPDLEYGAAWNFSGDSCAFTYESKDLHVVTTVFKRADILKTMPDAFLKPVENHVWEAGLRSLVQQRYVRQKDLSFMWRTGALDCYAVSRDTNATFPEWTDIDFDASLGAFLEKSKLHWNDVDSPSNEEYEGFWQTLTEYLLKSDQCRNFMDAARAVISYNPQVEFVRGLSDAVCKTNVTYTSTTNLITNANPDMNVETRTQSDLDMLLPIAVCSNLVCSVIEEKDVSMVHEIETVTIVRTVDRIVRKRTTTNSGSPRFEALFLSGGCIGNVQCPQTDSGRRAARAFSARLSRLEREKTVLSALRENPGDAMLWNLFGRLLQEKGEAVGAIVCFRNALRLDRTHEYALTNLAVCYDKLGKKQLACSTALIASGVVRDGWCVERVGKILDREW